MKKILFLILLLSCQKNYSQSKKSYECIYTVYTIFDDESTKKSPLAETILKSKPIEYKLLINNFESFYEENSTLKNDDEDEKSLKIRRIISSGVESVKANFKIDQITQHLDVSGSRFCIETKISDNNWNVSSEKKTIDNYDCYKATIILDVLDRSGAVVQKQITAYFAPSIPIQGGPLTFFGLPGLILEIQDKSRKITLKSIKIIEGRVVEIPSSKECNKIFDSQIDYEKFIRELRKSAE